MVAALIMGAAIRPRPVFVKVLDRQIVGFHGVGITR
jgi:hypothetical protein